jgi:hypothetical protein
MCANFLGPLRLLSLCSADTHVHTRVYTGELGATRQPRTFRVSKPRNRRFMAEARRALSCALCNRNVLSVSASSSVAKKSGWNFMSVCEVPMERAECTHSRTFHVGSVLALCSLATSCLRLSSVEDVRA